MPRKDTEPAVQRPAQPGRDAAVTEAITQARQLSPDTPERELLVELEAAQLRSDHAAAEVFQHALARLGYHVEVTVAPAQKQEVEVSAERFHASLPEPTQHLRPAAESGSADLHKLLGEYEVARMNGNRARAAVLIEEAARLGFRIT